jgi:hypothetical protein
MELEVFLTIIQQTYSKTCYKFCMNRKFSCGYATHFFFIHSFSAIYMVSLIVNQIIFMRNTRVLKKKNVIFTF